MEIIDIGRIKSMSIRSLVVIERRAVPLFKVHCDAELAFGTILVPVTVRDVSTRGCGVIIAAEDSDLPDEVGGRGILRPFALAEEGPGVILPVILRNVHVAHRGVAYGLEFVPLLGYQSRSLAALLEAIVSAQ